MKKISIIGAGRVGESTAQSIACAELAREVVLIDVVDGAASGAALDIQESAPLFGFDTTLSGGADPAAIEGSNLVIITAGLPRKPGMSRSDVLEANIAILDKILDDVLKFAPESKLLLVSNPVDVLTYYAWKKTGWDRSRVFGQAGVLDSARMRSFIAMETGFSVRDITAMVLGGHGDAMVPLPRFTCINGLPIRYFLDDEGIERIAERTRQGGAEILALKQNSSAYDAPAASVTEMVDAMSHNRKRVLPSVAILEGEYGLDDIAIGVPAVLGSNGLERVVELPLNETESEGFANSVAGLREDLGHLGTICQDL